MVPPEAPSMLGDDRAVLADDDALGIGMDVHRSADSTRCHRVLVAVEAYQAGLRDRRRDRVEPVERPAIIDQRRAFVFEHLPDCLVLEGRMGMPPGVGHALVQQPSVHLLVGLEV